MPYQDWIDIVESTIESKDTLAVLEFGLGEGTKYLLEKFKFVYSYELNDNAFPELINWFFEAEKNYGHHKHWGREVSWYNEIGFVDYDPNLPTKLLERIDNLFSDYSFEVVLVDGVGHCRGDVTNYILNKHLPEYVIIHDTNFAYEQDGYTRITLPSIYSTVKYTVGEGTHIFVKNK
jgi:hypothetical protein